MRSLIDPGKHDTWLKRTQPTLDYVDATLRSRRTAVDVGAAEGLITEWLADRFDVVHAFEPLPENFALLSKKDWSGNVICHNVALGDLSGVRAIEGHGHSAHITDRTDCQSVHVATLDTLAIPDVDLIKIDVEG